MSNSAAPWDRLLTAERTVASMVTGVPKEPHAELIDVGAVAEKVVVDKVDTILGQRTILGQQLSRLEGQIAYRRAHRSINSIGVPKEPHAELVIAGLRRGCALRIAGVRGAV